MLCAVLGPAGTFSEEAAQLYWGEEVVVSAAPSIPALFTMLARGEVEDVMIPIDNSQAGSIHASIDGLQEYPVCIKGEIIIPIRQHLIAARKYAPEEIELLVSQPVALLQCSDFIELVLPGVRTEICNTTTGALQIAGAESRKAAAIGNLKAARIYGLEIIQEDIQNQSNTTRFLHIGRAGSDSGPGEKASLIFSLPDTPGSLYKALGIFATKDLNLSKIESRPDNNKQGRFCFYIEVEMGQKQQPLNQALEELQQYCKQVKYLGSYNKVKRCPPLI
jgi:prephenate dehydratase